MSNFCVDAEQLLELLQELVREDPTIVLTADNRPDRFLITKVDHNGVQQTAGYIDLSNYTVVRSSSA